MNARKFLTAAALGAFVFSGPTLAADDEINELPEGIIAKLARMSAKNGGSHTRDRDDGVTLSGRASRSFGDCGSLNIGNVEAGKAGTRAPRQVIVVVKGPVVNSNNKCR